ncbi:MAG: peptidylprolyl isomerase [Candidatus Cloacimonetes bacterium]|nr:peptidylprolyl isomerase [Candidatus Cloacimonadota bacterium]MBS3767776.1 peptidylprolyl isomerase [Candidatus Cloacimonadota bacterium]
MLNQMRSFSRPITIAIAIIFVGGMATMGITQIFSEKHYVGEIDGEKIKYKNFYEMVQQTYSNYRENNPDKEITEELLKNFNDQTWQQLIQQKILNDALDKYDIEVTDKEIAEKIIKEPPEMLMNQEALMTDGKFDYQKYLRALKNPEINWSWLERYYYKRIQYEKLRNIINADVIVTREEVKNDYIQSHEKAKADVISFTTDLVDSVGVTEQEIQNYYNEFKDNYWLPAQRKLKFVKIPLEPSAEDEKYAENQINDIFEELQEGADFAELAREHSEGPSKEKGGDLGWFSKGRMVKEFEEVAFSLEPGDISEPVRTQFGWHIIQVVDKRVKDGKEEANARHILIKVEPGASAKRNQEKIAFDFYERCKNDSFEVVAEEFGYKVSETKAFDKEQTYIPGLGKLPHLVDFAFKNTIGAVAQPYQIRSKEYVVASVSHKSKAHYKPLAEVEEDIISEIENMKKMNLLEEKAEQMAKQITPENFDQFANENNLKVTTTEMIKVNSYIRGVGRIEKLNKAIIELGNSNKAITDLIKGDKGYYIAKLLKYQPAEMEKFKKEYTSIREDYINQEKRSNYNDWYENQKEEANIKDWRANYFQL